jgi:hypothetical protein
MLLDTMQGVQLVNDEVPVDTNIQLHSCYINQHASCVHYDW